MEGFLLSIPRHWWQLSFSLFTLTSIRSEESEQGQVTITEPVKNRDLIVLIISCYLLSVTKKKRWLQNFIRYTWPPLTAESSSLWRAALCNAQYGTCSNTSRLFSHTSRAAGTLNYTSIHWTEDPFFFSSHPISSHLSVVSNNSYSITPFVLL